MELDNLTKIKMKDCEDLFIIFVLYIFYQLVVHVLVV